MSGVNAANRFTQPFFAAAAETSMGKAAMQTMGSLFKNVAEHLPAREQVAKAVELVGELPIPGAKQVTKAAMDMFADARVTRTVWRETYTAASENPRVNRVGEGFRMMEGEAPASYMPKEGVPSPMRALYESRLAKANARQATEHSSTAAKPMASGPAANEGMLARFAKNVVREGERCYQAAQKANNACAPRLPMEWKHNIQPKLQRLRKETMNDWAKQKGTELGEEIFTRLMDLRSDYYDYKAGKTGLEQLDPKLRRALEELENEESEASQESDASEEKKLPEGTPNTTSSNKTSKRRNLTPEGKKEIEKLLREANSNWKREATMHMLTGEMRERYYPSDSGASTTASKKPQGEDATAATPPEEIPNPEEKIEVKASTVESQPTPLTTSEAKKNQHFEMDLAGRDLPPLSQQNRSFVEMTPYI
jgi:hypothetical protein